MCLYNVSMTYNGPKHIYQLNLNLLPGVFYAIPAAVNNQVLSLPHSLHDLALLLHCLWWIAVFEQANLNNYKHFVSLYR